MFFSSTARYALLLLPVGVLSAIARQPMVAGRAKQLATNSTKATTQKTTSTRPDLSTITRQSSWDGVGTIAPVFCPSAPTTGWCRVSVGTVQLNFWPTGSATKNHTYPTTKYLSKYDYTMTSPWVYFIINTMIATDWCGNLIGTTVTDFITSYVVTDVSTLQPFVHTVGTARVGPPKRLKLSDLRLDCPEVDVANQTYEEIGHNFVEGKFDPGCNPDLEWPTGLKTAANGLWKGCGRHYGGKLGIFDPPAPVAACPDDDPGCLYVGAAPTTSSSSPVNAALTGQPTGTTTGAVPLPTITSSAPLNTGLPDSLAVSPTSHTNSGSGPASNEASTEASILANTGLPDPLAASPTPYTDAGRGPAPTETSTETPNPVNTGLPDPPAASLILHTDAGFGPAFTEASTKTSNPVNTGLPDPPAAPPTLPTDAGSGPTSTEIFTGASNPVNTGFPDPPAASPTLHTDAESGPAFTEISTEASNPVNTGLPDPLVASPTPHTDAEPGSASTEASKLVTTGLPTPPSESSIAHSDAAPNPVPSSATTKPTAIATLAGLNTISATPGASEVVVGSQTATLGGAPITVSGQVVQLQSSAGLVVQNIADGSVSTFAIPSAAASPVTAGQSIATFEGQTISGVAIASSVAVVGGQTLSVGGSVVTLSGNQVASLGSSGVLVQAPGGGVTTIAVPKATPVSAGVGGGVTGTGPVTDSGSVAETGSMIATGSVADTGSETATGSETGTRSVTASNPASTSIGALILTNFGAGDRSRQLCDSVTVWLGSCLVAAFYLV